MSDRAQWEKWLDAQLNAVPIPEGLLEGLRTVAWEDPEVTDRVLREVEVPQALLLRLHRIPRTRSWLQKLAGWASAVGMFLALAGWQMGLVLSMVGSLPIEGGNRAERIGRSGWTAEWIGSTPLNFQLAEASAPAWIPEFRSEDLHSFGRLEPALSAGRSPRVQPWGSASLWPLGSIRREWLDLRVSLAKWPVLASPVSMDGEDLWTVPVPAPRGVDPPLVPGFPWTLYRRWGVHPFVSPAVHPALAVSEVPLELSTASFELARMYLARGMLPPREAIRTEEFLAAIDYPYPRPRAGEKLRLILWAGPSMFRGGQFHMLQVGVQAEDVRENKSRPGTSATLLLDCSSSMQWGARWGLIVEALRLLQDRLGPKDRLDVVMFQGRAWPMAEQLQKEDLPELIQVLSHQEPFGSTHLAEAFREGYALARRHKGAGSGHRLILLTDGLVGVDPDLGHWMDGLLAEAAAEGIRLDVVDLGQERLDDQPAAVLAQWAARTGGKAYRATNAQQILWALLESITGQSQRVATEVRLRVVMNPRMVISYRLLGHESKAIVGLKPPRLTTEFHSGQSGTVLYEMRLASGPPDEVVATAELSWRDPQTGRPQWLRAKLLRKQVASTVLQSPLGLQAAMVAAQTAELLRESPWAGWIPTAGQPKTVLETARQLDSQLLAWPSFQQMLEVLEKIPTAKPYRPPGIR